MIIWHDKLYLDESIKKKIKRIKYKLEQEKVTLGVYCIALASNRQNLLDIMNVNELLFHHYRRNEIYIVGLAATKESAIDLVQTILLDIYKEQGNFKVRDYFVALHSPAKNEQKTPRKIVAVNSNIISSQ